MYPVTSQFLQSIRMRSSKKAPYPAECRLCSTGHRGCACQDPSLAHPTCGLFIFLSAFICCCCSQSIYGSPLFSDSFTKTDVPGTAQGCLWACLCLSVTQDLLSTFELDLLFLEGGFLRKSISDFSLLSHGQRLHAAQVRCRESGWGAHTWVGGMTAPTQCCHCPICVPS